MSVPKLVGELNYQADTPTELAIKRISSDDDIKTWCQVIHVYLRLGFRKYYKLGISVWSGIKKGGTAMKGHISKGLRIILLIYAIYTALYGLRHVISPELLSKAQGIESSFEPCS